MTAEYPDHRRRQTLTSVGGGTGGFLKGRLFEKAGVHTSAALARFSAEMAAQMPGADKDPTYFSASISVIVHLWSPRTPTVHMNARFLSTARAGSAAARI